MNENKSEKWNKELYAILHNIIIIVPYKTDVVIDVEIVNCGSIKIRKNETEFLDFVYDESLYASIWNDDEIIKKLGNIADEKPIEEKYQFVLMCLLEYDILDFTKPLIHTFESSMILPSKDHNLLSVGIRTEIENKLDMFFNIEFGDTRVLEDLTTVETVYFLQPKKIYNIGIKPNKWIQIGGDVSIEKYGGQVAYYDPDTETIEVISFDEFPDSKQLLVSGECFDIDYLKNHDLEELILDSLDMKDKKIINLEMIAREIGIYRGFQDFSKLMNFELACTEYFGNIDEVEFWS